MEDTKRKTREQMIPQIKKQCSSVVPNAKACPNSSHHSGVQGFREDRSEKKPMAVDLLPVSAAIQVQTPLRLRTSKFSLESLFVEVPA